MKDITELQKYLESKDFSQLFILVDENTSKHCLPTLLEKVDILTDNQAILLEIPGLLPYLDYKDHEPENTSSYNSSALAG